MTRHLTLVPDLPPPPDTRKPWRPRKRRRAFQRNLTYQHIYEELMIVHDIRLLGGEASVAQLKSALPMRYDPAYLVRALERMRKAGRISRHGSRSPYTYTVEPTIIDILDIARSLGVFAA